jgi:predicted ArsR family transcriptional regulator
MWKVVYIAQSHEAASKIKQLLAENGFLTQISKENSRGQGVYEISVPFSETEEAYEVLCCNRLLG